MNKRGQVELCQKTAEEIFDNDLMLRSIMAQNARASIEKHERESNPTSYIYYDGFVTGLAAGLFFIITGRISMLQVEIDQNKNKGEENAEDRHSNNQS